MSLETPTQRTIAFSPPDISDAEIEAVTDVLRGGWITTGPKTKLFERSLIEVTKAAGAACVSSATAALECGLRALGIGPGDEVITSAYTYTASASAIVHVGATPILCDTAPDSYEMDYDQLEKHITEKTKAIIPIDIAGRMCNYEKLRAALTAKRKLWRPRNDIQKCFDRVIIFADGAHSFGAKYRGQASGSVADFTALSFHAVKNLTTAEGGALLWIDNNFDNDVFYQHLMLLSLHGQTKDAHAKNKGGSWEYDIAFPGWKCNMTDIQAALGLVQLRRYPDLLEKRRSIVEHYEQALADLDLQILTHNTDGNSSSYHLMLVRLNNQSENFRNAVITFMSKRGIATNVHYKPLPLLTAYKNLNFDILNFPHAYRQYQNEITLPLHTLLTYDDVNYIAKTLHEAQKKLSEKRISTCIATESRGFI